MTIRNQRSRWGSCSSRGHITLNFRLMLMPPEVREYILIHELMHLRQANHSIRFWRLVEAACPGVPRRGAMAEETRTVVVLTSPDRSAPQQVEAKLKLEADMELMGHLGLSARGGRPTRRRW